MIDPTPTDNCRGCTATVRLAPGEVARILASYLKDHPSDVVDETAYNQRLSICASCPDLQYRTTCRHCGCLVAVRAMLANKSCPAIQPRWTATQAPAM